MKFKRITDSFNYAIEGILYSVRTQRNMRIHMVVTLLVLTACFFYDISKVELLIITTTITLVLVCEMINTAIESTIDATMNFYHPLAKIAKNTAAGAVLISAVNAVLVGFIIFFDKLTSINYKLLYKIKSSNPYTIFILLILVCLITIIVKAIFGEGTPLKGGMPSGHSAIAFSLATTIALITEEPLSIMLSFLLAFIVAQSRVDSEVHSVREVFVGGVMGILITVLLFKIFI